MKLNAALSLIINLLEEEGMDIIAYERLKIDTDVNLFDRIQQAKPAQIRSGRRIFMQGRFGLLKGKSVDALGKPLTTLTAKALSTLILDQRSSQKNLAVAMYLHFLPPDKEVFLYWF